jgi:hypothetical protein
MECPFTVGQRAVCIRDDWQVEKMRRAFPDYDFNKIVLPHEKQVLTIRAIHVVEYWGDLPFLWFHEISNAPVSDRSDFTEKGEPGFIYTYFRPVKETSIEQFRKLLAPTPTTTVREHAYSDDEIRDAFVDPQFLELQTDPRYAEFFAVLEEYKRQIFNALSVPEKYLRKRR